MAAGLTLKPWFNILLSAATLIAGSGCSRVVAMIKRVRRKVFETTHRVAAEDESVYGIQQALHICTGLLYPDWGDVD
ncbi:hypothetical protein Pmar_PMAR018052 [Perkinsus marinus ATCC 50983]|uniref:Uncharacterized protein n=1 Tax=Perkinsus marinus (strain ATCC 50983 / TXsc) TaxID=423536 RepID=C5KRV6_PERM5|nr:hypothetical protein Pmar_PMAR018052 [Perkinsus marinus ATCC 50983]EER12797.1 hypothetical protein Pmar_PMAR018052 [Perkinsus marinus ATCC 50983]|eukprot:XP_002781002.1 hypothetical protein Pmar_PMAR018052 [Perkinsus marinus ATCC 50983]